MKKQQIKKSKKLLELQRLVQEQLLTEAPCNGYYQTQCELVGYHSCTQGTSPDFDYLCYCEDEIEPWEGDCYTGIGTGVVTGGGPTYLGKPGTNPQMGKPVKKPSRHRTTPPGLGNMGNDPMTGGGRRGTVPPMKPQKFINRPMMNELKNIIFEEIKKLNSKK